MDDDYELVPKAIFESMKKENEMLKEQLKNGGGKRSSGDRDEDDMQKEKKLIFDGINEIKDLNQHMLDNLINRTEVYEQKFDAMIDTFEELINSFSSVVEILGNKTNVGGGDSKISEELKTTLAEIKSGDNSSEVVNKLAEMDKFLKDLKVLLSYIKPGDIVTGQNKIN